MAANRYADDYETVITQDEKGNEKKSAVYRGDYYRFDLDEEGIVNFRRISFLLLTAIIVLHVCGGFLNNLGMYQFYVALPYVIAFFPLLYLAAGVLRLPKEKRRYRREEIGLSFDRLKTASIVLVIFLAIGILGEVIFLLFFSTGEQSMLEYLYLALEMLSAATVYTLIRLARQIHVKICTEK